MKKLILFVLLQALIFISLPVNAKPFRSLQCKIVGVSDGDTVRCLYNNKPLKVRLLYIDAPESSQPFGKKSMQLLSRLVFKKYVTLKIQGYDRYNRVLGVIYDKNLNVNLKMVQAGLAWAYRYNSQDIYRNAQQKAKSHGLGLWRDKSPIEPYEWRKSQKLRHQNTKKTRANSLKNGAVNCKHRLSCKKISSYNLAVQYFHQCAWGKHLDGNNDGIPCNKLYRK
ncbi:Endonuclease yncB precursor [Phocoenobacter uteri]|uniref:Endonuclease yncB n=1 Tax=Phocoenobacter uteri TaxID=146806 RepID=A0A379C739_9PAST|nr:thermonuclease family protein [Phocoenobacter uteri]MDG6882043.1 hypothetical protein [Phocoenobacter uteri]SUB58192.1 Endonuclease yncB precursor [Phocoenobacter uteri]